MGKPLGVGLLGAGLATQAIHLPVIASLHDRLRVVTVMDVDADLAARVADRCSARAVTKVSAVTEDPAVDIVVVCSPNGFHADQVIAACEAGKRAVLCEKPLATTVAEAELIAAASAATGVPVIVGTMHAFDPAYAAARRNWGDLPETATLVRSVIYLPANDVIVGLATNPAVPAVTNATAPPPNIGGVILGLAIHAIPLIRSLVPDPGPVSFARLLKPTGYSVTCTNGERAVQLIGFIPGLWAPDWTLRAWGRGRELRIDFPPSYVLAGSATACLTAGGASTSWHYPLNGYQAEWEHVADVAQGRAEAGDSLSAAVSDLVCAISIADQAGAVGFQVGSQEAS